MELREMIANYTGVRKLPSIPAGYPVIDIPSLFEPGDGWQKIKLDQPVCGRYICIEALNSHSNREYACIAEWYILKQ